MARGLPLPSPVRGVFRIFRNDSDGLGFFDFSSEGFFRSLITMAYVVPVYCLILSFDFTGTSENLTGFLVVQGFGVLLEWAIFLAAMAWFARVFQLSATYVPFIVVYNWSQVVVVTVLLFVTWLVSLGLLPPRIAGIAVMIVFIGSIFLLWRAARIAFQAPVMQAAAVVILEFLMSWLIRLGVSAAGYELGIGV